MIGVIKIHFAKQPEARCAPGPNDKQGSEVYQQQRPGLPQRFFLVLGFHLEKTACSTFLSVYFWGWISPGALMCPPVLMFELFLFCRNVYCASLPRLGLKKNSGGDVEVLHTTCAENGVWPCKIPSFIVKICEMMMTRQD